MEQLKYGLFEVVLSPVVFEELGNCEPELKNKLLDYVAMIDTTNVEENEQMSALAGEY